jgi:2-polyprenyl-6-methoxyphenol hydroxylase-like FAD-dependent oxidoreductase
MSSGIPRTTPVLIAGGGPVGLATAVELGRRGIGCVVVEPRDVVTHARPRCKTVNVRTMEHLRRWGLADRLRERAPLSPSWSRDIVFCTSLTGRELSRFTGVLGLPEGGQRYPEQGQQAPQFVLEELLRETVDALEPCQLVTGWSVVSLEQKPDEVQVVAADRAGRQVVVAAEYVVGADGPRSAVRREIGAAYVGERALRPNFGMLFSAPALSRQVAHGPAIQYWVVNPDAPSTVGPLDGADIWWIGAIGVDQQTGERDGQRIIRAALGLDTPVRILSRDPWTARMQQVDQSRVGRVFLAGDAAHLNPPFGGHGLNTGFGDAVDLGWKLAAVLDGWGGPTLLDSYAAERRPVQDRVIAEATANMRVLPTELLSADLDADGPVGDRARAAAHVRIQQTKYAEFHALDLVLGSGYDHSPVVAPGTPSAVPRPGYRLPHRWLAPGHSIFDTLGVGFSLVVLAGPNASAEGPLTDAARDRGVPLTVVDLRRHALRDHYGCDLILVRPDQHVAWVGDLPPRRPGRLLDLVRGQ